MSYQVLARKWRPRTFEDMVGQEHVLKALVHALDHQRLHHAYLFTGTRGVGKTTLGRLLAKSLNCEEGVSSHPCGLCDSCREIAEGRFVDLIEIDAASRTGVDDMRELTDNVQYSPTRGRYKVYLIDEVHMLTNQSFNAFLKTLEEPPEHVKFLLATTDPQKLPVTILSRCLQFNLKRMTPEHIAGHLRYVLDAEQIPAEDPALWLLARAADGSMRDALSLTDQAIAFGNEKIAAEDVSAMLGSIDQRDLHNLLTALVAGEGKQLLNEVRRISDFAPDYSAIFEDLLSLFHRITLEQVVPGSADNAVGDVEFVRQMAGEISPEDAQLFYQTALMGRKDLAVTPDARMGFEMTLLRMLAFRPAAARRAPPQIQTSGAVNGSKSPETGREADSEPEPAPASSAAQQPPDADPVGSKDEAANPVQSPAPHEPVDQEARQPKPAAKTLDASKPLLAPPESSSASESGPDESVPLSAYDDVPWDDGESDQVVYDELTTEASPSITERQPQALTSDSSAISDESDSPSDASEHDIPESADASMAASEEKAQDPQPPSVGEGEFSWMRDFAQIGLNGMTANLASHTAFERDGEQIRLVIDAGHGRLLNNRHQEKILEALKQAFGDSIKLEVVVGEPGQATPAAYAEDQRQKAQAGAVAAIHEDPVVQRILSEFDARLVEESIRPVSS